MKDYALAVEVGKIVASTLLDKARLSTSLIENQTYYSLTDLQRVLPKEVYLKLTDHLEKMSTTSSNL